MFADNSISSVKTYFKEKLGDYYPEREIQIFFEWSVESRFGLTKTDLLINDRRFSESELIWFVNLVKELRTYRPIQYILNEAHFLGEIFHVKEGVLVPRPETEELVIEVLKVVQEGQSVLDIGTGSGVIPISLKLRNQSLDCTGIDVSEEALQIAQKNADCLSANVELKAHDVLSDKVLDLGPFDIIVSNPPYVLESDKEEMNPNVLGHEPALALFVRDHEPLKFYQRIIDLSKVILKESGWLFFEIHEQFGQEVANALDSANFDHIEIIQDLQGKDRIVRAQKKPSK